MGKDTSTLPNGPNMNELLSYPRLIKQGRVSDGTHVVFMAVRLDRRGTLQSYVSNRWCISWRRPCVSYRRARRQLARDQCDHRVHAPHRPVRRQKTGCQSAD